MNDQEALEMLNRLLSMGREKEWVERKEAKRQYDFDDLGKYFSALSNEANLAGEEFGWLIFGVADDGSVVGTQFKMDPSSLESFKHDLAKQVSNHLSFVAIHSIAHPSGKRILLFQVPAALRGIPTSWQGHFYGRDGESLVPLNLEEIERIRHQAAEEDWTAGTCGQASLADLSPEAIHKAREEFARRNPHLAKEIETWDDPTFLNKAMVTIQGQITRAAVILLGKPESEVLLSPSVATISWILKDEKGQEQDYKHFGPPLILNVSAVYGKVRNLRYRHMPNGKLFPLEVDMYDDWVFREALHNCIAHQDYTLKGRIAVVETPDQIIFQNAGSFIPDSVEQVIMADAPATHYRNPFLAHAMVNLNMIDTIGSGIKRMFRKQRERYFPLPIYRLSRDSVSVTIIGRIIDPRYVQLLSRDPNLSLADVMLLDKVQKGFKLTKEEAEYLRNRNLVEGRYPRLHISAKVADVSGQKAQYLHTRGLDEKHYADLIVEHIRKFGKITRKEADELLLPKLPDILDQTQKKHKVNRLLSAVLKNKIKNIGSRARPEYILTGDSEDEET